MLAVVRRSQKFRPAATPLRCKETVLAVVRPGLKFRPPQPPSRGCGTAKIYSAGDGHYLYLQIQFGEDRCTQFRVIVVTDPQTHIHTLPDCHRQDQLQYTVPLSLACSVTSLPITNAMATTRPTVSPMMRPRWLLSSESSDTYMSHKAIKCLLCSTIDTAIKYVYKIYTLTDISF